MPTKSSRKSKSQTSPERPHSIVGVGAGWGYQGEPPTKSASKSKAQSSSERPHRDRKNDFFDSVVSCHGLYSIVEGSLRGGAGWGE